MRKKAIGKAHRGKNREPAPQAHWERRNKKRAQKLMEEAITLWKKLLLFGCSQVVCSAISSRLFSSWGRSLIWCSNRVAVEIADDDDVQGGKTNYLSQSVSQLVRSLSELDR